MGDQSTMDDILKAIKQLASNLSSGLFASDVARKSIDFLCQKIEAVGGAIWLVKESSYLNLEQSIVFAPEKKSFSLDDIPELINPTFLWINSEVADLSPFCQTVWQFAHQEGSDTVLIAPLRIPDRSPLGLIALHGTKAKLETHQPLLEVMSQQIATTIRHSILYEASQDLNYKLDRRIAQERDRQRGLYKITNRLTSTLDLTHLIERTLEESGEIVGSSDGYILINDDSFSIDLNLEAEAHALGEQRPLLSTIQAIAQHIMKKRQPLLIEDLSKHPVWGRVSDHCASVVGAPLKTESDLHGVLILTHHQPRKFPPHHQRLLETIAVQLASAVNNARLHDFVRTQVVRLGELLEKQEYEDTQRRALLSSIRDGVIASDKSGKIILVNPTAEHILHQQQQALLGQSIHDVLDIFAEPGKTALKQALNRQHHNHKGSEASEEVRLETEHEIINGVLSQAYLSSGEFMGVVTVLRNITKEVEADRAKTEFISTVSHELRTPMTSIKGYADFIYQEAVGPLTAQQKHFLDVIRRNADRLSLLINDLLDVSRIEAGKVRLELRDLQMKEVAEQVAEAMLIPAQNKGLELVVDAEPDLPLVKADWDRMTQVLTNLVGNAINYTETGRVTIHLVGSETELQIRVKDTGIGIPEDVLPHILDRFYRAGHPVVQANSGTGLGLSIAQSFIDMHGGQLMIESTYGEGSTFSFVLPAILEKA